MVSAIIYIFFSLVWLMRKCKEIIVLLCNGGLEATKHVYKCVNIIKIDISRYLYARYTYCEVCMVFYVVELKCVE